MSEDQLQSVKRCMEQGCTFRSALILVGVMNQTEMSPETVNPLRLEFSERFGREETKRLRAIALPPLRTAADNAAGAAGRALGALKAREKLFVTPRERKNRLATCMSCPLLNEKICSVCRCNVKRKTRLATEKCPEDKW